MESFLGYALCRVTNGGNMDDCWTFFNSKYLEGEEVTVVQMIDAQIEKMDLHR